MRALTRKILAGAGLRDVLGERAGPDYGHAVVRPIQFIAVTSAAANNVSIPSDAKEGDCLLVMAFTATSTTQATRPSGWTGIATGAANSIAAAFGFRVMVAGDTGSGTWTNATHVLMLVFRNCHPTTPVINWIVSNGTASPFSWTGLTLREAPGSALAMLGGAQTTITNLNSTSLTGTVTASPGSGNLGAHYKLRAGSWSTTTKAMNTNASWRGIVIELNPIHSLLRPEQ